MIDIERLPEEYEIFFPREGVRRDIFRVDLEQSTSEFLRVIGGSCYSEKDERAYLFTRKTLTDYHDRQSNNPIRIRKKPRQVAKDVFRIRAGHADWGKDSWVVIQTVDELEQAKEMVSEHQRKARETNSPFRFMMKKEIEMGDLFDYDQWADFRFSAGEWDPVPWANEPWVKPELAYHFAHMCKERDPGVAFWESPEMAQRDKISSLTIGAYLNLFYGDVLTPCEIEEWVHRSDPPGEIVLSGKDPEAIYEAYHDPYGNTHSCMTYRDGEPITGASGTWRSDGKSPVRVYGAGDLEVAQLVRRGKVVARALVWPEKKVVGRIYGDVGRMRLALQDAGWTFDGGEGNDMYTTGAGGFEGARLLKLHPESDPGNLVAPYLDFHYRVAIEEDHCYLTKGKGFISHRTDGLLFSPGTDWRDRVPNDGFCGRCGAGLEEDDWYSVDSQTWCYDCYECHSNCCDGCNESFDSDDLEIVQGNYACPNCVQQSVETCNYCNELAWTLDMVDVFDANTSEVHGRACDGCVGDGDDVITIGGRLVAATTTAECFGCGERIPDEAICECRPEELEAA